MQVVMPVILRQPWKSRWWGGGGGGELQYLFSLKNFGQFSRQGVGVSSYITNLSDKQASKEKQTRIQENKNSNPKGGGGVWIP